MMSYFRRHSVRENEARVDRSIRHIGMSVKHAVLGFRQFPCTLNPEPFKHDDG